MLINDLPDDCLMIIFGSLILLKDLVLLSKVCRRWKQLITYRLAHIKYLINHERQFSSTTFFKVNYQNTLNIGKLKSPQVKLHVNEYLPNLKIIDVTNLGWKDLKEIIANHSTIKGVIDRQLDRTADLNIFPVNCFVNISMLSIINFNYTQFYLPENITQLYLHSIDAKDFEPLSCHFNHLKRLHIHKSYIKAWPENVLKFNNLKMLEFKSSSLHRTPLGYRLVDHCPNLESAFLLIEMNHFWVDVTIKNYNLRDLVIQYTGNFSYNCLFILRLISKFPNLKHLAIRGNKQLSDNEMVELITLLPEIKLIDLRGSPEVTRESVDYLKTHCHRSNRSSIMIYHDQCDNNKESSKWPKIGGYTDICGEFNFMKNCFFTDFYQLPYLLD